MCVCVCVWVCTHQTAVAGLRPAPLTPAVHARKSLRAHRAQFRSPARVDPVGSDVCECVRWGCEKTRGREAGACTHSETCTHTHKHIHTHTYIYTYTQTHTHTHTCRHRPYTYTSAQAHSRAHPTMHATIQHGKRHLGCPAAVALCNGQCVLVSVYVLKHSVCGTLHPCKHTPV